MKSRFQPIPTKRTLRRRVRDGAFKMCRWCFFEKNLARDSMGIQHQGSLQTSIEESVTLVRGKEEVRYKVCIDFFVLKELRSQKESEREISSNYHVDDWLCHAATCIGSGLRGNCGDVGVYAKSANASSCA